MIIHDSTTRGGIGETLGVSLRYRLISKYWLSGRRHVYRGCDFDTAAYITAALMLSGKTVGWVHKSGDPTPTNLIADYALKIQEDLAATLNAKHGIIQYAPIPTRFNNSRLQAGGGGCVLFRSTRSTDAGFKGLTVRVIIANVGSDDPLKLPPILRGYRPYTPIVMV